MKKSLLLLIAFIGLCVCPLSNINAQGVGISPSGNAPNSSAGLDVDFSNKGILIPRITTAQRDAINSPAEGLQIFNTTTKCFEFYASGVWQAMFCSCISPSAPTAATQTATSTQIVWNWNAVGGVTGYKYSTVNSYTTAADNGATISYTQTGLTCNTAYTLYVWAYNGACYSLATTLTKTTAACFTCGISQLFDSRDGQSYNTVQIGSQCWMGQNLNYGTMINSSTGGQLQTNNATPEKYCYGNSTSNCSIYGALYEWGEMMQYAPSCNGTGASQPGCSTPVQGLCPTGWHLPSHYEWTLLEKNAGSSPASFPYDNSTTGWLGANEGSNMKVSASNNPPWDGNNSSGFSILPAGYRQAVDGTFVIIGTGTYFWTTTESDPNNAWYRHYYQGFTQSFRANGSKQLGFYVRCLQN